MQTGLADVDFIEITEGVQDGTRLVTVGALALRDGDRISVIGAGGRGGGRADGRRPHGRGRGAGRKPNRAVESLPAANVPKEIRR